MVRIAWWNSAADSRTSRLARWGRIDVWIAWNSWSGARTISSTLNTNPVIPTVSPALLPAFAATISTPAFINVCSASMIPTTDTANPLPPLKLRSAFASSISAWAGPSPAASATGTPVRPLTRSRENANGITHSDANGATAMPRPTAAWPDAIPTATASANMKREVDSRNTSPPYSANRWCPASQPRAK